MNNARIWCEMIGGVSGKVYHWARWAAWLDSWSNISRDLECVSGAWVCVMLALYSSLCVSEWILVCKAIDRETDRWEKREEGISKK